MNKYTMQTGARLIADSTIGENGSLCYLNKRESKLKSYGNRHCGNLLDLMKIANELFSYLKERDFQFTDYGCPIFKREMFLNEWPEIVIPYSHRNSNLVKDKRKTVLCHFTGDKRIYPRLVNLLYEIDEYRQYLGVISTDITVTMDMVFEWQRFIILINELYLAVLAVNGIKIVLSTRCGTEESLKCFEGVPRGIMCASSFLGCEKKYSIEKTDYLSKILSIGASKVIIYGSHSQIIDYQLCSMGIDSRTYLDYHQACKRRCS